jgi:hypothetical protein
MSLQTLRGVGDVFEAGSVEHCDSEHEAALPGGRMVLEPFVDVLETAQLVFLPGSNQGSIGCSQASVRQGCIGECRGEVTHSGRARSVSKASATPIGPCQPKRRPYLGLIELLAEVSAEDLLWIWELLARD